MAILKPENRGASDSAHRTSTPTGGPDLSIVILTFNRKDSVLELLSQLERDMVGIPHEVIVVDNCSSDGTTDEISKRFPDVDCLVSPSNIGVGGRNLGMTRATGPVVVTLDDDILGFTANDAARLKGEFEQDPKLGALNFRVIAADSGRTCNWVHHRPIEFAVDRFTTYEITEGAVAIRREALDRAGMYYEKFFISHEGPDLAFRLMNAGYNIEFDGTYCVQHKHDQRGRPGWRFYYYDTRNQLWLAARSMPFTYGFLYLLRGLSAMAAYSTRDGYLHYWFKAVFDGLRGLPTVWQTRSSWSEQTRRQIHDIDSHRPNLLHMLKTRVLRKDTRLDG